jgi:hypothetical protein
MADADLLEALKAQPDEVQRAIQGKTQEDLRRPASDGGWGAIEHLAHLRDWEEVALDRVRAVLGQDRPELPAFDDDLWPIERDYSNRNAERMAAEFAQMRGDLVAAVERAPAAAWEREGIHGVAGPITLRWLLTRQYDHAADHIRQVRDLLA